MTAIAREPRELPSLPSSSRRRARSCMGHGPTKGLGDEHNDCAVSVPEIDIARDAAATWRDLASYTSDSDRSETQASTNSLVNNHNDHYKLNKTVTVKTDFLPMVDDAERDGLGSLASGSSSRSVHGVKSVSSGIRSNAGSSQNYEYQREREFSSILRSLSTRGDLSMCDLTDPRWKARWNRSQPSLHGPQCWSITLLALFAPNASFALGSYKYGGLFGKTSDRFHVPNDELAKRVLFGKPTGNQVDSTIGNNIKVTNSSPGQKAQLKHLSDLYQAMGENMDMKYVRLLGYVLGKAWSMLFAAVQVDIAGIGMARRAFNSARANKHCGVLLLPTHRSHIDYLLMSYCSFGFNFPIPIIAAGNNLQMPLIGHLFHKAGAFFIRRSFTGDKEYGRAIRYYILSKLQTGATVEMFVQGGRSRTGQIGSPKLGILQMVVSMILSGELNDVVLLPASIDYDIVLESEEYANIVLGCPKKPETFVGVLRTVASLVSSWMFGSSKPKGKVFISISKHMSLRSIINEVINASHGQETNKDCVSNREVINALHGQKTNKDCVSNREVMNLSNSDVINVSHGQVTNDDSAPSNAMTNEGNIINKFGPREIAARVGREIVKAQRDSSVISPVAVVSALLLQTARTPLHVDLLAAQFAWFVKLIRSKKGIRFGMSMELVDHSAVELFQDSLAILRSVLDRKPTKILSKRIVKHKEQNYEGSIIPVHNIDVVQRLCLRYSMGELPSLLGDYAVVASAIIGCQHQSESHHCTKMTLVMKNTKFLGEVLNHFYGTYEYDESNVRDTVDQMRISGCFQITSRDMDSEYIVWSSTDALHRIRLLQSTSSVALQVVHSVYRVLQSFATSKDVKNVQYGYFTFTQLKNYVRSLSDVEFATKQSCSQDIQSEELLKCAVKYLIHREVITSELFLPGNENTQSKAAHRTSPVYRILPKYLASDGIAIQELQHEIRKFCNLEHSGIVDCCHVQDADMLPGLSPLFNVWRQSSV